MLAGNIDAGGGATGAAGGVAAGNIPASRSWSSNANGFDACAGAAGAGEGAGAATGFGGSM